MGQEHSTVWNWPRRIVTLLQGIMTMVGRMLYSTSTGTFIEEKPQQINLADFDNSPLRFLYDMILEEYRTLRGEITSRLVMQQQITNFSIGLMTVSVAASQFIANLFTTPETYLILFPVFSLFIVAYAEHDYMIAFKGTYINKNLRKDMDAIMSKIKAGYADWPKVSFFNWDQFRSRAQKNDRFYQFGMSGSQYMIMMLPVVIAFLGFCISLGDANISQLRFVLAIVAFAVEFFVSLYLIDRSIKKVYTEYMELVNIE